MAETGDIWRAVIEVAGRQQGLVTREQLDAAGASAQWVRGREVATELVKLGWRIYAVPPAPRTWEQSALAACLDVGRGAVVSHATAAAAWRLLPPRDEIHVTISFRLNPGGGPRTAWESARPSLVVHRSRALGPQDRTTIGRLPVTTAARTIVDLAASTRGEPLAGLLDRAFCQQVVTPARVSAAVDRCVPRGRKGIAELRERLAPWLDGHPVESVAEGAVQRALAEAGLPAPVTQHEVALDRVSKVRLDFAWPSALVGLEIDSYRWHSDPRSFSQDFVRANRLAALGWTVIRATPTEFVEQPHAVMAALARHLDVPAPASSPSL